MTDQLTLDADAIALAEFPDRVDEITSAGEPAAARAGDRSTSSRRATWMSAAERQLDAIENLPDGWDSHGGARPNRSIVGSGRSLLRTLAQADTRLSRPHICPTPSGGVQFQWESEPRSFEVELVDPLTANYYFVDRHAREEVDGAFRCGGLVDELIRFIRRVDRSR